MHRNYYRAEALAWYKGKIVVRSACYTACVDPARWRPCMTWSLPNSLGFLALTPCVYTFAQQFKLLKELQLRYLSNKLSHPVVGEECRLITSRQLTQLIPEIISSISTSESPDRFLRPIVRQLILQSGGWFAAEHTLNAWCRVGTERCGF
jgi:hypothetical protein